MYGVIPSQLNSLGAHVVDVWEIGDVRHIRKICKSFLPGTLYVFTIRLI